MIARFTGIEALSSGGEGFGSTAATGAAGLGALAAVSLLANHEQEPPSAEQPLSQYGGGEEQGEAPRSTRCHHQR